MGTLDLNKKMKLKLKATVEINFATDTKYYPENIREIEDICKFEIKQLSEDPSILQIALDDNNFTIISIKATGFEV